MKLDTILCGDCAKVLACFPDACIDLTVTSPPYDNLRTYNGYVFDFEAIAQQLYRVTKLGGVVVWVVGDATIDGSETLTSFKHALYFREIGFNVHDTMIYLKDQLAFPDSVRYYNAFEYMFVFSKGILKTFNPIKDRINKSEGRGVVHGIERKRDGTFRKRVCDGKIIGRFGVRWNYWIVYNQQRGEGTKHPASFPESLARDHILSWSNPGDVVLDPMCGSGTTLKMAKEFGRHYIGIDISEEYCELSRRRVDGANVPLLVTQ